MDNAQRIRAILFLLKNSKTKSRLPILLYSFLADKIELKKQSFTQYDKQLFKLVDNTKILTRSLDGGGINQIYKNQIYELLPSFRPKKDSIVVDVGAYVGVYSIRSSKLVKNGFVVAVEPSIESFNILRNNIKMNNVRNIIPINAALGNFNGKSRLYVSDDKPASNSIHFRYSSRSIQVNVKRLDKLLKELGIKKVNLIKIDAEGSELDVLKGAGNNLKQKDLKLVISVHSKDNIEKATSFLEARGFSTRLIRRYRETLLYAQN